MKFFQFFAETKFLWFLQDGVGTVGEECEGRLRADPDVSGVRSSCRLQQVLWKLPVSSCVVPRKGIIFLKFCQFE
jgi:hypothetical protein